MSDDDTSVIMEDTISVLTSPPRKSRTGDPNLLLFSPAQGASPSISDGTRDSPLKYGSRHDSPLSIRKSGYNEPSPSGFGAPPARTSVTLSLFQPDSDVEDDGVPSPHQGLNNKATSADPADQEESLQDLLRQFSPQHPAYAQGRRFTLKPLDLNHHGLGKMEDRIIQDAPSLHRQGRPPLCRDRSTGSTETSETGEPTAVHRRKRASPERRRLDDPKTPYRRGNLFQAEPANLSATPSMHISPHISPNSFLTIDGRFVHSKNPFSSPMMTEEDVTPRPHRTQHQMAPTFPVSFPNTDDDDDDDGAIHPARLPPRTRTSASRLSTPPSSARGALRGIDSASRVHPSRKQMSCTIVPCTTVLWKRMCRRQHHWPIYTRYDGTLEKMMWSRPPPPLSNTICDQQRCIYLPPSLNQGMHHTAHHQFKHH